MSGRVDEGVNDVASWDAFWGNKDSKSLQETISFALRRPNNSFNHRYKPEDWELSEDSKVSARRYNLGAKPANVGAGPGFSRFRSSILYNEWKQNQVADAK